MWKDIEGFEGKYKVSDDGNVMSLERHVNNGSPDGMTLPTKILKQTKNPDGYMQVSLMNNGKRYVKYVHRLVANAFIANPDGLPTVNHIDGDKSNNHVSNLEFATYSCNNQHAYDSGLRGKGENHYLAKLTAEDVRNIRRRGKYSTYEAIGNVYGVSKATIRDVLIHRTWAQAY